MTVLTKFFLLCGIFLRWIGLKYTRKIASGIGTILWYFLRSRRKIAIESIQKHLNLSQSKAKEIARESFRQNALSFLETAFIPLFGFHHPLIEVTNAELKQKMSNGEYPVVAVTAHIGAWELLAGLFGDYPKEYPHIVVVRHYKNKAINDFTIQMRSSRGSQILGHRDAVMPILRALKKKGMVAFLVDHNTSHSEAIFLPFLGELAAVNKGPALLALRAEAHIFSVFLIRKDEHYVIHIEDLLDTKKLQGDREIKIETIARAYTQAVERIVRLAPEQWFWMHKRWKTRPE